MQACTVTSFARVRRSSSFLRIYQHAQSKCVSLETLVLTLVQQEISALRLDRLKTSESVNDHVCILCNQIEAMKTSIDRAVADFFCYVIGRVNA